MKGRNSLNTNFEGLSHGIDINRVQEEENTKNTIITCRICKNIPWNPQICSNSKCEAIICQPCLKVSLNSNTNCPICQEITNFEMSTSTMETLSHLKFKCQNYAKECKAILDYSEQPFHLCPKDEIKCEMKGCEWEGKREMTEEHLNNCEFRVIPCPNEGCQELLTRKFSSVHMNECPHGTIEDDKSLDFTESGDILDISNGESPQYIQPLNTKEKGNIDIGEISLDLLFQRMKAMENELLNHTTKIIKLESENEDLKLKFEEQNTQLSEIRKENESLKESLKVSEKERELEIQRIIEELPVKCTQCNEIKLKIAFKECNKCKHLRCSKCITPCSRCLKQVCNCTPITRCFSCKETYCPCNEHLTSCHHCGNAFCECYDLPTCSKCKNKYCDCTPISKCATCSQIFCACTLLLECRACKGNYCICTPLSVCARCDAHLCSCTNLQRCSKCTKDYCQCSQFTRCRECKGMFCMGCNAPCMLCQTSMCTSCREGKICYSCISQSKILDYFPTYATSTSSAKTSLDKIQVPGAKTYWLSKNLYHSKQEKLEAMEEIILEIKGESILTKIEILPHLDARFHNLVVFLGQAKGEDCILESEVIPWAENINFQFIQPMKAKLVKIRMHGCVNNCMGIYAIQVFGLKM